MHRFRFLAAILLGVATVFPVYATAQKVELTLWHQEQPPNRVKRFQEIIDAFNASHPDIVVTQQVQDWNTVYQKLSAAAAVGRQPDIMFVIPDFAQTVLKLNLAQPVTDLVQKLDQANHFVPAAIAPYHFNGQYWAVPLYGMEQVLWYRKDLFQQAGITSAPKTWAELVADAQKLTKDGKYGIAVPAGKNLASDQVIYSFMITAGAENMFNSQCQVTFDSPATVKTLTLYSELLKYSPPDATSYSWGEPQALFNSGKSAMAIEKGQYLSPFVKESGMPASDLGMAEIPQPAEGGQPGTIYYSNAAMIFTKDPAKQKAADEFLTYVLQPDVYGRFLNAEPGLFLPLTETGLNSTTYWEDPVVAQYKDYVKQMIDYSKYGALFGFTGGYVCPAITAISQQDLLAQTVQQIAVGGMTPEQAAKWGQQQMEAAVKAFNTGQ